MKNKFKIENINYSKILTIFIISIIFILINSNNLVKANQTKEIYELIPIYRNSFDDLPSTIDIELHNDKGLPVKNVQAYLDIAQENYEFYTEVDSHTNAGEEINYELRNFPNIEGLIYNKLNNKNYYSSPIITVNRIIKQGGKKLENDFRVKVIKNDNLEELNNKIGEEVLNITTKVDTEIEEAKNIIGFDENGNLLNYKIIIEPIGQLPEGFVLNEEQFLVKYVPPKGDLEIISVFNTGWKAKRFVEPKIFLVNPDGSETRIINKNNLIAYTIEGFTEEQLENDPNAYEITKETIEESEKILNTKLKGVPIKNLNGDDVTFRLEFPSQIDAFPQSNDSLYQNSFYFVPGDVEKINNLKYSIPFNYGYTLISDSYEEFVQDKPFMYPGTIEYKYVLKYKGVVVGEKVVDSMADKIQVHNDTIYHTFMYKIDDILYPMDGTNYDNRYLEIEKVMLSPNLTLVGNVIHYTPPKANLVINKIWNGGSSLKPESIEVVLKRRKEIYENRDYLNDRKFTPFEEVRRVRLSNLNNWTIAITDLDQTDDLAIPYEYVVEEINSPDNFETTYDGLNITNTYISPKKNLNINLPIEGGKKESLPQSIEIKVKTTQGLEEKVVRLSLNDQKTGYIGTVEVNQTTNEGIIVNHIYELGQNDNFNYVLENNILKYLSPKTTVTGIKQWENGPSVKPAVTFDLYRNNVKVEGQSKIVPSSTNRVTWDNLDQTDVNGNAYTYSVDEQAVTGYTKTKVNTTTIKNTYVVNNTTYGKTISVVGGPSIKPTVQVKLKRNGQLVVPENKQTINLNTTTNFNFTNLPSTDLNGNTYTYDVEVQPVTNYNVTRDTSGNVTLTYVPPTGEVVVNKVFSGGSTTNRPSVTLQVKKNGVLVEEKVAINTGDNINYRATFNLPRTENNGSTITYTVDEKVVPANYTKSISGMTVTNTYVSPKTQITKDITKQNGVSIPVAVYLTRNGQKVPGSDRTVNSGSSTSYTNLDLTDNSENRYTYEIVVDRVNTNLPDGYTINDQGVIVYTPTTKPYTVTIPVNGGNKESLPSIINVELTNDKNLPNKTVTATLNQDKTAYVVNENVQGTTNNAENVTYTARALTNIPNYTLVNNTYTYVSPNTTFTKLIPKENGQPISVKVQLTRDGQVVSPLNEVTVNTGENATFTNLPQTDTNGRPYVYDIKIVPNGTLPEGYTITNNKVVYTSPKINFTIEKVWNGGSTLIPDTIEVKIKRRTQTNRNYTDVKTVLLRKDNNWQLVVNNLENTDENEDVYEYAIEEVTRIANFTGSVNNFRITNTYTSPNQTVTKQVAITTGGDNKPTVKVVLVASGQEVTGSEQTVNLNDTNIVNWENKPTTNNDGTPITYTLKVKEIVTNPNNNNGTYTITDDTVTFVPNKITVNGSVQIIGARALWQDVQVDLYKNGQKVVNTTKTMTVSDLERANNNLVLINYPELDKVTLNNEVINYEIKASTNIDKFNKNVTGNNTVYTYTSETTNVPYTVNIIGGGSVPNITVRLKNGNTVVNTHNLNGQTAGTFTNVPLRDSITGNPINYTVEYTLPSEYVKQDDGSYKYVSPKKDVTANISFVNGKAPRPNVEVQLLRNGQTVPGVNNVTLQNGQTSYTFTNLDKTNEQGVDYTYSINIVNNVEDYTKSYPNNLNAVLTYVQRVGEKQFTINREGGESVPVTINLVKNGEVSTNPADTKVVNTGNTVTYTNLELTDINGNTNTYNIVVTKLPEGYTGVINNDGTINVKYTSPKIDIEVNKIWVNGDTLVPNEIEVKLQRRVKGTNSQFTDVQTFTVTKDNNWSKTITNLDKTNESAKVYEYKVIEVTEIENFTGTVNNFEITNTYTSPRGNKEFIVNVVGKDVTLPIVLTKDGQKVPNTEKTTNGGTVTYTNLDLTNSDGTTIDYKLDIDMGKLSDEIKNRYDITKDTIGNITVTYKPERTDITKTVSIPENLKDTLKFVEVELLENGKPTGIIKQIPITDFVNSTTNTKLLTNDVTFTNVNKTDINGNTINYDINLVTNIPGYEITKDTNGNIVIKKIIEQKDIIANVNFDGGQLRPNVVVELIKDNKVIKTIKTSSSGNINFGKQDITDEYGNTIEYTFNVQNKNELRNKNYDTKVVKNSITLEYISPKINIDYKLILQGGVKEELPKIQVQLLQNGNPIGNTVTLDENLRYVFENMDETNKDGIKYNYSIVVIGDIQGYEVINVNNNVSILRRKIGESINIPNVGFLPYAGAENNIAFSIMLIIGIYVGSKTFVRTRKSFGVKNINKRGLRRK